MKGINQRALYPRNMRISKSNWLWLLEMQKINKNQLKAKLNNSKNILRLKAKLLKNEAVSINRKIYKITTKFLYIIYFT